MDVPKIIATVVPDAEQVIDVPKISQDVSTSEDCASRAATGGATGGWVALATCSGSSRRGSSQPRVVNEYWARLKRWPLWTFPVNMQLKIQ